MKGKKNPAAQTPRGVIRSGGSPKRSAPTQGVQLSKSLRNTKPALGPTLKVVVASLGPDGLAVADRLTPDATVLNFTVVEKVMEPAFNVPLPSAVPPHEPAARLTCVLLSATTLLKASYSVTVTSPSVAPCVMSFGTGVNFKAVAEAAEILKDPLV